MAGAGFGSRHRGSKSFGSAHGACLVTSLVRACGAGESLDRLLITLIDYIFTICFTDFSIIVCYVLIFCIVWLRVSITVFVKYSEAEEMIIRHYGEYIAEFIWVR